jgi:2-keto-4-pentenoate hydratase
VTTGSWTGLTVAEPGSASDVKFSSAGEVHLRFE